MTLVDFDTSFDNQYWNNQNAILDQNQPKNQKQNQHIPNDVLPVPGGEINEMMQEDPFHAMNIPGGDATTILEEEDIPFLCQIPIAGRDPNTLSMKMKIKETIT
jgi:hypothetical protein